MADATDVQSLFLQVDASVELLRRNLATGEQPLQRFEQRAAKMAANVDASIEGMGKRFGAFAQLAETAAAKAEKSFNDSFDQIQKMAAKAIQGPTVSGGINFGAADARTAANEARQQAAAIALIEQAARRAAAGQGEMTRETRLYLQAASAARIEAERHAADLTREAAALERLEIEARAAAAGQRALIGQQNGAVAVSGQQRQATMMLGQQVQDFAVQVSNGGSVVTAFSQQIGQAAFAVQGMGGRLGAVAAFLGTGWGAATVVGLTVLAPLVAKIFEGNDGLEEALNKLKKEAAQTAITDQAHAAFAKTLEGQIDAQRRLNDELDRSVRTQSLDQQLQVARSKASLAGMQGRLGREEAEVTSLEQLRARASTSMVVAQGVDKLDQLLRDARAKVAQTKTDIANTARAVREAEVPLIQADVAGALDKRTAATNRYEESLGRLNRQLAIGAGNKGNLLFDEKTKTGYGPIISGIDKSSYERQLTAITKQRDVAIAAASAEARIASPGASVRSAQGDALFSTASSLRGQGEGSAGVINLLRNAGINVDPKKVAWCAAFVNSVLATNNLPGTGSLGARSFLNYGTATDSPVRGDIVVSKRGTGAQGHVGFYQGRDANGNVQVLGGNTGNKVGTMTVAARDVLGFRRAPTASAIERTAVKTREDELNSAIAYSEQERQARRRLLDATLKTAASEEQRDQLLRDDINGEADAQKVKIDAQKAKGDLDDAQAKHLLEVNEAVRQQRLQNVAIAKARAVIEDKYLAETGSLDAQIATTRIELDMAVTTAERKRLAVRLLALEQELERKRLEEIRDTSDDPKQVQSARDALGRLPDKQALEQRQTAAEYKSPMEEYKDRLRAATGDMNEALEGVEVNALQGLEDGLTGIITGTESVAGAFKRMASSIIADLARIAIEKLIVNSIGGSFLGLATGGKVEGKAGGGLIRGPGSGTSDSILALVGGRKPIMLSNGESIVTAEATAQFWPLIDAMNKGKLPKFAAGGLVSPRLPSLRGAGGARGGIIEQHFHVNAQGSVLASDLMAEMRQVGLQATVGGANMARQRLRDDAMAQLT